MCIMNVCVNFFSPSGATPDFECNGPPHPIENVHTRTQQNRSAILFVFVVLFTCRPSGALGYLLCGVFYKHVAPLGLNAPVLLSSNGLGNPTPTHTASLAHLPIFVPPGSDVAPLGLNAAQLVARYPSWGEVSSPNGLGNPTPTNSIVR